MKYQGSKQRILNGILPLMIPEIYNKSAFVDAFCGGCSVVENMPKDIRRIANDKNKYLIAMWKSLTNDRCRKPPMRIERDFYCDVRDSYNNGDDRYTDGIKGWVGFMASWNGRYFDGGYSGHNVVGSNGKTRDYITENINNTLKQVPNLKGVEWQCGNYWEMDIPDNSLIYCDPPYKGTKEYVTSRNFDYEKFYDWCRMMYKKGHTVFVSEYNMPSDFYCVWSKEITNSMHQKNTYKPVEKLFIL